VDLREELEQPLHKFLPLLEGISVTRPQPTSGAPSLNFDSGTPGVNIAEGNSQKPASRGRCAIVPESNRQQSVFEVEL
jgi:hypothetical protein